MNSNKDNNRVETSAEDSNRAAPAPEADQAPGTSPLLRETAAEAPSLRAAEPAAGVIAAAAADDDTYYYNNYMQAPFTYNQDDAEHVNLNTGALSYTVTDFVLPGKNGMDLVIKRRFDAALATNLVFTETNRKSTGIRQSPTKYKHFPQIGLGWCLNLPLIEYAGASHYLHLGDGRVFSIGGTNNLSGYKREDWKLSGSGRVDIHGETVTYQYKLRYKDGTSYYLRKYTESMTTRAETVAMTDRFDNGIRYKISQNGMTITDSFQNVTTLAAISGGMRWTLPDGRTVTYTLEERVNNEHERRKAKLLTACTVAGGGKSQKTVYDYTPYAPTCRLDTQLQDAVQDYRMLSRIIHPTGADTYFDYDVKRITYADVVQEMVMLAQRSDVEDKISRNAAKYSYTYPENKQIVGTATVESTYNGQTLKKTYNFDGRSRLETESARLGNKLILSKTISYDIYDLPKEEIYTKPVSKTLKYSYNKKGDMTSFTDALGRVTTMTYDANFSLPLTKKYKQKDGVEIEEVHTLATGNPQVEWAKVKVGGTLKKQTKYLYDAGRNLKEERRYYGALTETGKYLYTTYTYDAKAAKPKQAVFGQASAGDCPYDKATRTETYQYNSYGQLTKKTVSGAGAWTTAYDFMGRVTNETFQGASDEKVYSKTYTYTIGSSDNKIVVKDEGGNSTRLEYTKLGKIKEEWAGADSTGARLVSYTYDSDNNLSGETRYAADGKTVRRTISFTRDWVGRLTGKTVKDAAGTTLAREEILYDDEKMTETTTVHSSGNAPSIVTVATKDKLGRVVKEVCGDSVTEFIYDFVGNKTKQVSNGRTTSWEYDFAGNITKGTDSQNKAATISYDELGNKKESTSVMGFVTKYTWDTLGRLKKQTNPFDGSNVTTTEYTYNALDKVTTEKIQCGVPGGTATYRTITYTYTPRGWLQDTIVTVDGQQYRTRNEYDNLGNKTAVYTGMLGNSTSGAAKTGYKYNRFGKVTEITDPANGKETYTYDKTGRLEKKTDRNGAVTTYTYDGLDRVLRETVTVNGKTDYRAYTYTQTGEKATADNGTAKLTYAYNSKGLLSKVEEPGRVVKTYEYHADGSRAKFELKRNNTLEISLTYTYDKMGRMETVKRNNIALATYKYYADGCREKLTVNGTGGTELITTYAYNSARLLTAMENKRGSALLSSYRYAYNLDGLQRSKTAIMGGVTKTTAYTYDDLGRLKREQTGDEFQADYTYDRRSNRLTKKVVENNKTALTTYTCDIRDRLTAERTVQGDTTEDVANAYDANGNLVSRARSVLGPRDSDKPGSVGFQEDVACIRLMKYNGFGQLTWAYLDGKTAVYTYRPDGLRHSKTVDGSARTHIWDGGKMVAEYAASGNTVERYLHGASLIARQQDSQLQYYLLNGHGDVVQRTNQSGDILKRYDYDAFGGEREPEPLDSNPFRYCGEYFDEESGNYYLRNRLYNPRTGRFSTEDPIRAGLNWYTYCINNPLRYIDPSGLTAEDINKKIAALLYLDDQSPDSSGTWCEDYSHIYLDDGTRLGPHQGIDFNGGTTVYSISSGKVVYAKKGSDSDYSMLVVETFDPTYQGESIYIKYLHLAIDEDILEKFKEDGSYSLQAGHRLGEQSSLGQVTGPHTHIELTSSYGEKAARNTYGTSITTLDPTPYFDAWLTLASPWINDNPPTGGDNLDRVFSNSLERDIWRLNNGLPI